MDNSIKISTQVLKDTATQVRSINAMLDERLKEINATMDSLSSTWQSDAADDIRQAMRNLNPRFEEYWKVVNSYATFLDDTALKYDATESQIEQNASKFM